MQEIVTLRAGRLEVGIKPAVGGAVTHFCEIADSRLIDYMRRGPADLTDVLDAACFPLVPFCNRLRDGLFTFRGRTVRLAPNLPPQKHPLHGQAWRGAWSAVRSESSQAELAYRHEPGEWPWAYEARQTLTLDPDGLSIALACTNLSDEPMPCGLGLHPFYPCNSRTVLDTGVEGVLTVDAEIMPVERLPAEGRYSLANRPICGADLDNGYDGWSGRATLSWPDRGRALVLTSAAPFFQVYSPLSGGILAAEPVMNANGALNAREADWAAMGLTVLGPGEECEMSARFAVTTLTP